MVMITGGAYQGKTAYAMQNCGIHENEITDGKSCTPEDALKARCITDYHEFVRRLNSSAVIIMNEVGSGIIPMEKSERTWRENVGRCGCIIASRSEKVIRIVCGIPTFIKGEQK